MEYMDLCLLCGKEYNPIIEPDHEETCQTRLADSVRVEVQADPILKKLLESLLNETR